MNKKVLSAILFSALFAGTGTFTSCIDNDEPAGIEELRGAKAELIRAKIAVEEANALAIAADAALTQAKAETEKAVAAYQKALADQQAEKVKQEALRTELLAAQNEADKARIQAEIAEAAVRQAEAEAAMVEAAKQHELNMKNMETSLLQYELAYQNALKDLKLAEVTLTDNQKAAVEAIKKEINGYYVAGKTYYLTEWILNPNTNEWEKQTVRDFTEEGYYVDGLMDVLVAAEQELFDAQQKLYIAMNNKEAGNDVAEAEFVVKVAEHQLADAKTAAAKVAELAAKEIASTDWEKEAATLAEEVKAIDVELKALSIEEEKIKAENKFAYDTVQIAYDAVATAGEKHAFTAYKNDFSANASLAEKVDAKLGTTGVLKFGDLEDATNNTFDVAYTWPTATTKAAYAYGDADTHLATVKGWLKKLEEITISENDAATAGLGLAQAEKDVEDAAEAYEDALADWTIAKNAYADGTFVTVPTTAYQAVVTAYNTNVEALAAAITAYNTKYTELYDAGAQAGKDEFMLTQKHKLFTDASKAKLVGAPYNMTDAVATIEAINLLNKTDLTTAISKIEALYAAPSTVTDATEIAKYAAGLTAVKAQLNIDMQQYALDKATDVAAAEVAGGNKALTAAINTDGKFTKELSAAKKAIVDAAAKLTAAADKAGSYAALSAAKIAYDDLAEVPYAQILTADAQTAAAGMTANATYAAKTAGISADYAKVYEIKTSTVTAEEFTAATATKKLEGQALKNVWAEASENAFGLNDRVIAATEEEVREADEADASKDLEDFGAMGAWLAAQNELAEVEGQISAKEDLESLIADVTAAKTKLEGEMAVAKAAVDAAVAEYNKKDKAYKALFAEINEEIEALKHEKATAERVMSKLNGVVEAYINGLSYGFTYTDEQGVTNSIVFAYQEGEDNTARLKHFFEEWTLVEEYNVLTAEGEVKEAKAFLAMVKEGKYDAVAMETRLVEKAQAAYDFAKANMDAAVERLAALLDSFDAE